MLAENQEILDYPFNNTDGLVIDPAYVAARAHPGMIRVQLPFGEPAWLATRYEDVRFVLGDSRFSRAMARDRDEPRTHETRVSGGILAMDPPDHTRLRSLVAKAFTMRRVEELRPEVQKIVEELIDDMQATGAPADLVEAFAMPLPVRVICGLLGVPIGDRHAIQEWSDGLMSTSAVTPEEFVGNFQELLNYMGALIARRRAEPADDLISGLIAARAENEDRLSEEELVDLCNAILVAGHEVTASQIPNLVHVLLENPDHLAELRADPSLIPAAVDELMRYIPLMVSGLFPRYAVEDVHVGEELVRKGEPVLVALHSANRDENRFDDAAELRFDRTSNPHAGFGHGVHYCLGAPLARVIMQEALSALLSRMPDLALSEQVEWKASSFVRSPRRMLVRW